MAAGDLASVSDVATELDTTEDSMSETQVARASALIARVSVMFAEASQREFAPGTYTHRLRVQYRSLYERSNTAFVSLPETSTVTSIVDDEGNTVDPADYTVDGREIRLLTLNYPRSLSFEGIRTLPYFVTVTYSHSQPVPPAVAQCVAGIVARYMGLADQAGSASPVATSLSDALGNRVTFAAWVTQSIQLLPEDLALARRYRWPTPAMVIGT